MAATTPPTLPVLLAVVPLACLSLFGVFQQWYARRIYDRIGDYSIGLVTFYWQLSNRGHNFPGPNILEAKIRAQPAELQADIQTYRHRMRLLQWAAISYLGLIVVLRFALFAA